MSRIIALTGRNANLLRLCSGVTASSSNTRYPPSSVYDGNPGNPWMALNTISPQSLTFDMNLVSNTNGGFENWNGGIPVGWAKTQNPASPLLLWQETNPAFIHSGTSCARFEKTTSPQHVMTYFDFEVPSGSVLQFRPWVLGGKAANGIFVQNLDTDQYLKPFSALAGSIADRWDPAPVLFHGFEGSALAPGVYVEEVTSLFRVEDWWEAPGNSGGRLPTYKDTTTIRVMIGWPPNTTDVGTFWVDDFVILPALDWASVHYHNLRTRDVLKVRYSDDGATYADLGAFDFGGLSNRLQQAYIRFTLQAHRWAQLRMEAPAGFNVGGAFEQGAAMIGELMLSQAKALEVAELYGHPTDRDWPQDRDDAGIYAYARAGQPTESRTLVLEPRSPGGEWQVSEELVDVLVRLYERSRGGAYPSVIVPDDSKSAVFYGRFPRDLQLTRENFVIHKASLSLRGFPPPVPI